MVKRGKKRCCACDHVLHVSAFWARGDKRQATRRDPYQSRCKVCAMNYQQTRRERLRGTTS